MTRTWFITGVSTGFGRHLAEQLLSAGDRVAGTVRRLDSVADLVESHGSAFHVSVLEMTDTAAIRPVVDAAHAHFGRLDVVVSNAGYGLMGAAEELTDEQVRHQLDTNLLGSVQVIRAAVGHLRADGGGRILQLSSVGGQVAWPGGSLYHATKWGIEGFADALADEVAPFGIGVTLVEPGGARTEFRYGNSRLAPKIDAYAASPASRIRRVLEERTSLAIGDPARMAAAMIATVGQDPAPRRLVLGSDAWTAITDALEARLADVRAQKSVAFSTDL
ncbi:SDR family oxidoreductase [Amycolatopsis sp. NPDC049253]|jgi:NAD(P)-dependent dehydrogenase (short-subunit alcohol dehydrogenase family)|uniref:SDR family oxidoreductase n=1 Tax=Amycolatopsis sp. NPDC049253 TaxID=3155274 RepID=UPI00341CB39D